jgi:hypothetical protein
MRRQIVHGLDADLVPFLDSQRRALARRHPPDRLPRRPVRHAGLVACPAVDGARRARSAVVHAQVDALAAVMHVALGWENVPRARHAHRHGGGDPASRVGGDEEVGLRAAGDAEQGHAGVERVGGHAGEVLGLGGDVDGLRGGAVVDELGIELEGVRRR